MFTVWQSPLSIIQWGSYIINYRSIGGRNGSWNCICCISTYHTGYQGFRTVRAENSGDIDSLCSEYNSDRLLLGYSWVTRSAQVIAPAIGCLGSLLHHKEVIGFTFDKFAFPACVMVGRT